MLQTEIYILAGTSRVWQEITEVALEHFAEPLLFRWMGIPKPLKAEVVASGPGGKRIAYFSHGKRFIQTIIDWQPNTRYSFSFNPENGFRVGYIFDLSSGVFRLPGGAYTLVKQGEGVVLTLSTIYSLNSRWRWLLRWPILWVLQAFQRYLLRSIKKNAES